MGHVKSAVLLLGRLLMATLFVFVGYTQASELHIDGLTMLVARA